jgi:hypothetical protein
MSRPFGNIKPGRLLDGMEPEVLGAIVTHPVQQAVFERIVELISWLRECRQPSDYDEFQRHLFGDIYETKKRRSKCRQAVRRLESCKTVSLDAVELVGLEDPTDIDAWRFEQFMSERLARQLRSVR